MRAAIALAAFVAAIALLVITQPGGKKPPPPLPDEARRALRLGWNEDIAFAGNVGVKVRFEIRDVAVGRRTWVVRAKIVNRSADTLDVLQADNKLSTGAGPSLLVLTVDDHDRLRRPEGRTRDARRPAAPGQARAEPEVKWSGTFAGFGRIPRQTLIYVGSGAFEDEAVPYPFPVSWNSRESFRLS